MAKERHYNYRTGKYYTTNNSYIPVLSDLENIMSFLFMLLFYGLKILIGVLIIWAIFFN